MLSSPRLHSPSPHNHFFPYLPVTKHGCTSSSSRKASWKEPNGRTVSSTTKNDSIPHHTTFSDDIVSDKIKREARFSDFCSTKQERNLGMRKQIHRINSPKSTHTNTPPITHSKPFPPTLGIQKPRDSGVTVESDPHQLQSKFDRNYNSGTENYNSSSKLSLDIDAQGINPPVCFYNGIIDFWNKTSHNDMMDIDIFYCIDSITNPICVEKNNVGLVLCIESAFTSKRKRVEQENVSPMFFVDIDSTKLKKQRILEPIKTVVDDKPLLSQFKQGRDFCLDFMDSAYEEKKGPCIKNDIDNEEEDEFFDTNQSECSEWDYHDSEFEDAYGDSFNDENEVTYVISSDKSNRSNGLDNEEIKLKDEMETTSGKLDQGLHILRISYDCSDCDNQDLDFEYAIDDSDCNDWEHQDSDFEDAIGGPISSEDWETPVGTKNIDIPQPFDKSHPLSIPIVLHDSSEGYIKKLKQTLSRIHETELTMQQLLVSKALASNPQTAGMLERQFPFDPGSKRNLIDMVLLLDSEYVDGDWATVREEVYNQLELPFMYFGREPTFESIEPNIIILFARDKNGLNQTIRNPIKAGTPFAPQFNDFINCVSTNVSFISSYNCVSTIMPGVLLLSSTKIFLIRRSYFDNHKNLWIFRDTDHEFIAHLVCSRLQRSSIWLLFGFLKQHHDLLMQLYHTCAQASSNHQLMCYESSTRSYQIQEEAILLDDSFAVQESFKCCNNLSLSLFYEMFNVCFIETVFVRALLAIMAYMYL